MALPGALSGAQRQDAKMPDDLSIIGFDNIALWRFARPSVDSAVAQPRFDMVAKAILLLLDECRGKICEQQLAFNSCELIIRPTRAFTKSK